MALLVVASHLWSTRTTPVNFDEAYNLQIPMNLYLAGQYQSWYDAPQPFPPQVTTGPSVLLPVAAAFAFTGVSLPAARAVMTLFLLGFLWQVYLLSRRVSPTGGNWVCAAVYGLFLLVPLAPWMSSIVLGELPSVFFLLSGITVLAGAIDRQRPALAFAAGLLLGLAVLAKIVAIICAVAILPAVLVCDELRGRRLLGLRFALLALIGLLVAPAAFEGVKIAVLGCDGYRDNVDRFRTMIALGGSGLDRDGHLRTAPSVAEHIGIVARELQVTADWVRAGLVVVGAAVAIALIGRPRRFVLVSVALACALFWTWWLRHSMWLSLRHLHVGYLLLAVLIPSLGAVLVERSGRRSLRAARLALLLGATSAFFLPRWSLLPPDPGPALAEQYAAAATVRTIAATRPRAVFWSHGWYQAAELSFLAETPFHDVTHAAPDPTVPNFLVLTSLMYAADHDHVAYAKLWCANVLVRSRQAHVCRLRPEAPRGFDRGNHP